MPSLSSLRVSRGATARMQLLFRSDCQGYVSLQERGDTCTHVYRAATGFAGHAAHTRARSLAQNHPGAAAALVLLVGAMLSTDAPAPGEGRSKSWQAAAATVAAQPASRLWPLAAAGCTQTQAPDGQSADATKAGAMRSAKRIAPTPLAHVQTARSGASSTQEAFSSAHACSASAQKRPRLSNHSQCAHGTDKHAGRQADRSATAHAACAQQRQCAGWSHATASLLACLRSDTQHQHSGNSSSSTLRPASASTQLALAALLVRLEGQCSAASGDAGSNEARASCADAAHPLCTIAHLTLGVPITTFQPSQSDVATGAPAASATHLTLAAAPLHGIVSSGVAASLQLLCLARRLAGVGSGMRHPPKWLLSLCAATMGPMWHSYAAPDMLFARGAAAHAPLDVQAACVADVLTAFAGNVSVLCTARCDWHANQGHSNVLCRATGSSEEVSDTMALSSIACAHACRLVAALRGDVDNQIAAVQMPPPAFTPSLHARSVQCVRATQPPALPAASSGSCQPEPARSMASQETPPLLQPFGKPPRPPPSSVLRPSVQPPSAPRPAVCPELMRAKELLKDAEAHVVSAMAALAVRECPCCTFTSIVVADACAVAAVLQNQLYFDAFACPPLMPFIMTSATCCAGSCRRHSVQLHC